MHTRTLTAVLASLFVATVALAQHSPTSSDAPPTLTVSAEGSVEIEPDRAFVTVGVVEEAETAKKAMSAVNKKVADTRERINELDIKGTQLTTSELSIQPRYNHAERRRTGKSEIIGYRASNTLTVRVDDIDRVGEVIDQGVMGGVNQMRGLRFASRDPFSARTRALSQATTRAKTKANVMAGAMGGTIDRVIDAREAGTPQPSSPMRGRAMMTESAAADFAPTPVEPGSLTITARVHIVYALDFEED